MKRRYSAPVAGFVNIATDNIMTSTSGVAPSSSTPSSASTKQNSGWGNLWRQ